MLFKGDVGDGPVGDSNGALGDGGRDGDGNGGCKDGNSGDIWHGGCPWRWF